MINPYQAKYYAYELSKKLTGDDPEKFGATLMDRPYAAEGEDKESLFVARVETILDKEHTQWPPSQKIKWEQNN